MKHSSTAQGKELLMIDWIGHPAGEGEVRDENVEIGMWKRKKCSQCSIEISGELQ